MADQQPLQPRQGGAILQIHRLEVASQTGGGPAHRLLPESLAAGEVAEQGAMADAHPLGDGRGADLIRGHGVSQLQQRPHGVSPALGGGNRGSPWQRDGASISRLKRLVRRSDRNSAPLPQREDRHARAEVHDPGLNRSSQSRSSRNNTSSKVPPLGRP